MLSTHLSDIHSFKEICRKAKSKDVMFFDSFDEALSYGKTAAARCRFQIRVKTTGYNHKDSLVYKYIVCKRQGLPEHGWKSLKCRGSTNKIGRPSERCNCRWTAKIVGLFRPNFDPPPGLVLRDNHPDLIWFWERADDESSHNHALDSVITPFEMEYASQTSFSRQGMNLTIPRPSSQNLLSGRRPSSSDEESVSSASKPDKTVPLTLPSLVSPCSPLLSEFYPPQDRRLPPAQPVLPECKLVTHCTPRLQIIYRW